MLVHYPRKGIVKDNRTQDGPRTEAGGKAHSEDLRCLGWAQWQHQG